MDVNSKRFLGDGLIVSSWSLYVALFLVLWAPLLPMWANCLILLAAVTVGHWFGSSWSRRARYGPPALITPDADWT